MRPCLPSLSAFPFSFPPRARRSRHRAFPRIAISPPKIESWTHWRFRKGIHRAMVWAQRCRCLGRQIWCQRRASGGNSTGRRLCPPWLFLSPSHLLLDKDKQRRPQSALGCSTAHRCGHSCWAASRRARTPCRVRSRTIFVWWRRGSLLTQLLFGASSDMTRDSFICVWHDPFICLTWLMHMCVVLLSGAASDMLYNLFICVTLLMTHACVWHDPGLIHMCDMPRDLFMHVTWLFHTCGMTHSYVCSAAEQCLDVRTQHAEFARRPNSCGGGDDMGWLRSVSFLKLQVSYAEYSLFYRALLQKRPMISRSLLIVATP